MICLVYIKMKSSIQRRFYLYICHLTSFFVTRNTFSICFVLHFFGHLLLHRIDAARSGDKYETSSTNIGYSKYMKLKIRTVGPNDYGSYRCVAKNSLGETDGLIKLEGKVQVELNCFGLKTNA